MPSTVRRFLATELMISSCARGGKSERVEESFDFIPSLAPTLALSHDSTRDRTSTQDSEAGCNDLSRSSVRHCALLPAQYSSQASSDPHIARVTSPRFHRAPLDSLRLNY